MELGERIRFARERAHMAQPAVAKHFGISRQSVSKWESGESDPKRGRLAELADLFQVNVEWLLTGAGTPDAGGHLSRRQAVPVIDKVAAGSWSEVTDPYAPGAFERYVFPDRQLGKHAFALSVDGRSMEPDFTPGDVIIIDPDVQAEPGDLVVAKLEDEEAATFKKFRHRGSDKGTPIIELVPLNDDFPTLVLNNDHRGHIIGPVVEYRRYPKE